MKKHYIIPILCLFFAFGSCQDSKPTKTYSLFVGTYTNNGSEGIYSYTFDSATGKLSEKKLAASMKNPSFLKISNDKKHLYASEETDEFEGASGAVAAFKINEGQLEKINTATTGGANPCHIAISADGGLVAASNYSGGSLSIFKVDGNGALLPNPQFIDHKLLDSTKTSHVHSAEFTADGLFTADLGLDAVKRYVQIDGVFVPGEQLSLDLPEKAGPRHFTFGQKGKFLYVINELNSSITTFLRNENGTYNEIATENTLAKEFEGESYCADIHLSNDGKFLYGSNRGENTIVIFKVDQPTGKLTLVGRESVKGDWPRNFGMDPSGKFLLVANQKSNNIAVFKRDAEEGTLSYLHEIKLPSPVCLEFLDL